MPRLARQKHEGAVFHIMSRSISEVQLFRSEEDKQQYLLILKEYQKVYGFIVYAYCLMDNHVHMIIFCNGADISKVMHCINFKYAKYYNSVHERHGHLFQDRFKSKIVTDDRYLIKLSAYIHNNPKDVQGYEKNIQGYKFSSLGIYLGLRNDKLNIVDDEVILSMFDNDKHKARKRYAGLVAELKDDTVNNISQEEVEFNNEKTEYRSGKRVLVRNFKINDVVEFVENKFNINKGILHLKFHRGIMAAKGILILLLRNLCNSKCKEICDLLGNITISQVSKLSNVGISLAINNEQYGNIINEFIECYK